MKILKQKALFEEVRVGDEVELVERYLLIRSGSRGKIVEFIPNEEHCIKVEFPLSEVGRVENSPIDPNDRFIYVRPSEIRLIEHKKLPPHKGE